MFLSFKKSLALLGVFSFHKVGNHSILIVLHLSRCSVLNMLLFIVYFMGKVSALEGGNFASFALPLAKLANASIAVSADLESTSPPREE